MVAVHIGSHRGIHADTIIEGVADLVHISVIVIGDKVILVGTWAEEERWIVICSPRDLLLSLRGQQSQEEVRDLKPEVRDAGGVGN